MLQVQSKKNKKSYLNELFETFSSTIFNSIENDWKKNLHVKQSS